jgi:hypothetical protein
MMYCSHCGNPVEHETPVEAEAESVAEVVSADVEIARINADKEIKLAQIGARVEEHVSEVDQAADLAHAEGVAEGMAEVITPPEPETPESPVIVVEDNPDTETPEITPPLAEDSSEPSEPKSERHGYGNAGWFGA